MEKTVLLILVNDRKESAVTVQKILTDWGCTIKTRLGIHDGTLDNCSNSGLIILEIVGDKKKNEEITRKLNLVKNVKAQLVHLSV
ncbi:MAG: hypothetical protein NTY22_02230 [Proteobacteria bacterium]|nr:hypothetical protein [Pseudomonadota bacterium]